MKLGSDISYCLDSNYHKGTNTTLKSRRQLVMEIGDAEGNTQDIRQIQYGQQITVSSGLPLQRNIPDDKCGDSRIFNGPSIGRERESSLIEDEEDVIKLLYAEKATSADRETLYSQNNRVYSDTGISTTISTYGDKNAHIIDNEEEMIKQLNKPKHSNDRVYYEDGVSPTINSMGGGNRQPFVVLEDTTTSQVTVAYSKSTRENHVDIRGRVNSDANTISTGDGGGNQSTQNFVTNGNTDIRIRKLTPVECEKLQGYEPNHTKYGQKADGTVYEMSNSQRYKQCGNGVSAPVSAHLLTTFIPEGDIKVLSLFSGIGGTELNLPPRFAVIGHCEFDKYASDVLRFHNSNIPNYGDVTKLVDRNDIGEFDLLVGGFPCQSWSISGLRKGFDDTARGQLIYNVFDILRKHKPRFFALENVKGLLSHNKGASFEAILEFLSGCGYELDFEVVNSKNFGLAQNRERVFIMGKRIDKPIE